MACPTCGQKFSSDFKVGETRANAPQGIVIKVFEMPSKLLNFVVRICRHFKF